MLLALMMLLETCTQWLLQPLRSRRVVLHRPTQHRLSVPPARMPTMPARLPRGTAPLAFIHAPHLHRTRF